MRRLRFFSGPLGFLGAMQCQVVSARDQGVPVVSALGGRTSVGVSYGSYRRSGRMKIPSNTWVLAMDGSKMLLLRNRGDAIKPGI